MSPTSDVSGLTGKERSRANIKVGLTPEQAREMAAAATDERMARSAWLLLLRNGDRSVMDLVRASWMGERSGDPSAKTLSKLRLRTVLGAQPGWGAVRVEKTMRRFALLVRNRSSNGRIITLPDDPKVWWITQADVRDKRMELLRQALDPIPSVEREYWAGWPWSPDTADEDIEW